MKINKVLIFILTFCIIFAFSACSESKNKSNNEQIGISSNTSFKFLVTVIDADGNAVEGVILQICNDSRVTARTNSSGIATFPLIAKSGYRLSIISCPDGYEYTGDPYIPIKQGTNELTLIISKK